PPQLVAIMSFMGGQCCRRAGFSVRSRVSESTRTTTCSYFIVTNALGPPQTNWQLPQSHFRPPLFSTDERAECWRSGARIASPCRTGSLWTATITSGLRMLPYNRFTSSSHGGQLLLTLGERGVA